MHLTNYNTLNPKPYPYPPHTHTPPCHQDKADLKKRCVHLTNYSVNKKSSKFVSEGGGEEGEGEDRTSKWSLHTLRAHVEGEGRVAWDTIWKQVRAWDTIWMQVHVCVCVWGGGGGMGEGGGMGGQGEGRVAWGTIWKPVCACV